MSRTKKDAKKLNKMNDGLEGLDVKVPQRFKNMINNIEGIMDNGGNYQNEREIETEEYLFEYPQEQLAAFDIPSTRYYKPKSKSVRSTNDNSRAVSSYAETPEQTPKKED